MLGALRLDCVQKALGWDEMGCALMVMNKLLPICNFSINLFATELQLYLLCSESEAKDDKMVNEANDNRVA